MIGGMAPPLRLSTVSLEGNCRRRGRGLRLPLCRWAERRLYVSHGTVAVVLDLDKFTVVGEVADTPGIHGIAIARNSNAGSPAMDAKPR